MRRLLNRIFLVSTIWAIPEFCLGEEPTELEPPEPKTVYIEIWNELGKRGRLYPIGDSGDNGVIFSCRLSRRRKLSESKNQDDVGFDYMVAGGSYPRHRVHHLSIQCGNFERLKWRPGDRLIVHVIDAEEPCFGWQLKCRIKLDKKGEQYVKVKRGLSRVRIRD